MDGSLESLRAFAGTNCGFESFPPAAEIAKRFAFETRLFQKSAPDHIRLEASDGIDRLEVADDRRRDLLTRSDARELVSPFGQMGSRRLAAVG